MKINIFCIPLYKSVDIWISDLFSFILTGNKLFELKVISIPEKSVEDDIFKIRLSSEELRET